MTASHRTRDEEIARLYGELEKAQQRVEEVAAYYRGELEAVRQRREEEAIRVQAAEAGRRKRAEEQVVSLKAECKAARAEADHALRRYHELQRSWDELEQQNEERARTEIDRHRGAANVAWKTAEEELGRLEQELCDLRRELEREREERRQFECCHREQEQASQRAEQERRRLMGRFKHALKLSEERRQRAEGGCSGLTAEGATHPRSLGLSAGTAHEVELAAGWGSVPVGALEEVTEEFLRVAEDRSLEVRNSEHGLAEMGSDSVSDRQAGLDIGNGAQHDG